MAAVKAAMLPLGVTAVHVAGILIVGALVLRQRWVTAGVFAVTFGTAVRALTVLSGAQALRASLSNLSFGKYLLAPGSDFFASQVRQQLYAELVGLVVAALFYLLLTLIRRRTPAALAGGEPAVVAGIFLASGWPALVYTAGATFALALFASLLTAVKRRALTFRVRLGYAAVIAALLVTVARSLLPIDAYLASLTI